MCKDIYEYFTSRLLHLDAYLECKWVFKYDKLQYLNRVGGE